MLLNMRKIKVTAWLGWRYYATPVMPIWVMFSLMVLVPVGCGSASTPPASNASMNNLSEIDALRENNMQTAVFGGGCFWCTEAVFLQVRGVTAVESGYSGGKTPNPTYREVSSGLTSHAEVVKITFDPKLVNYEDLLQVFFGTHDPTTLNRQGADIGTQYRSVVYYFNDSQQATAQKVMQEVEDLLDAEVVTEISPFKAFYKAEEYHQNYFALHPEQAYCQIVILPKLEKLREKYQHLLIQ